MLCAASTTWQGSLTKAWARVGPQLQPTRRFLPARPGQQLQLITTGITTATTNYSNRTCEQQHGLSAKHFLASGLTCLKALPPAGIAFAQEQPQRPQPPLHHQLQLPVDLACTAAGCLLKCPCHDTDADSRC